MKENRVTIKIPRPLYNRIGKIIEESGFSSPTEFIVYILRDLLGSAGHEQRQETFSQEELAGIRQKLKNLGYL